MPREDKRKLCEILRQGTLNYKYRDLLDVLRLKYPLVDQKAFIKGPSENSGMNSVATKLVLKHELKA